MNGRLSLPSPVAVARTRERSQYKSLAAYLLGPVAAVVYSIAFWRFAADMHWFGEFFIADGLFSKWQVWLALAVVTTLLAHQLSRDVRDEEGEDS